jgi:hypothetical protein
MADWCLVLCRLGPCGGLRFPAEGKQMGKRFALCSRSSSYFAAIAVSPAAAAIAFQPIAPVGTPTSAVHAARLTRVGAPPIDWHGHSEKADNA